jgi:hypothetical protein
VARRYKPSTAPSGMSSPDNAGIEPVVPIAVASAVLTGCNTPKITSVPGVPCGLTGKSPKCATPIARSQSYVPAM